MCLLGLALVAASGLASAQPEFALNSLTAPAANLPEGCGLKPIDPPRAPIVSTGVVHMATKLREASPSNPWSGTDPEQIALIRPAIEAKTISQRPLPDAFPHNRQEAIAWQARTKPPVGITEA